MSKQEGQEITQEFDCVVVVVVVVVVGKKEMIVSYNNDKIASKSLKYADIVRPGHVNQDLVRSEPHRAWVVEATLKGGKRHVYGKRVFYLDEDTWQVARA